MRRNTQEDCPFFSDILFPHFLALFKWMVWNQPTYHLKFRSQSRKSV